MESLMLEKASKIIDCTPPCFKNEQCSFCSWFEHFQWLHDFPGDPVPAFNPSSSEKIVPDIQGTWQAGKG